MPLLTDEEMGLTQSAAPQLLSDEDMGLTAEPTPPPSSPGVMATPAGPTISIPTGALSTANEWAKKALALTPVGIATQVVPEAMEFLASKIPTPTQKQAEEFIGRSKQLGGAFGGGFQGTAIPGMSAQESVQRQAASIKALTEEGKGFAEFTVSPLGRATMALGGPLASGAGKLAGTAIRQLIGAGFAADIARQVPDQYQEWLVAQETGTPEQQEAANVRLGSSMAMLAGIVKHQAAAPARMLERVPSVLDRATELGLSRASQAASEKLTTRVEQPPETVQPPPVRAVVSAEVPAAQPAVAATPGTVIPAVEIKPAGTIAKEARAQTIEVQRQEFQPIKPNDLLDLAQRLEQRMGGIENLTKEQAERLALVRDTIKNPKRNLVVLADKLGLRLDETATTLPNIAKETPEATILRYTQRRPDTLPTDIKGGEIRNAKETQEGVQIAPSEAAPPVLETQVEPAIKAPSVIEAPKPAEAVPELVSSPTTMAGRRTHHFTNKDIPGAKAQTFVIDERGKTPEQIKSEIDAKIAELRSPEGQGMVEKPVEPIKPQEPAPAKELPIISEVESAPASKFTEMATKDWKESGGLTGKAYEVGRGVKSQEEVSQLKAAMDRMETESKRLAEEVKSAKAKGEDIMPKLEAMAPLAMKKQFFREAYEAATGTGSAGNFLRKREPGYQPPFPIEETPQPQVAAQPKGEPSANQIESPVEVPSSAPSGAPPQMAKGAPSGIRQPVSARPETPQGQTPQVAPPEIVPGGGMPAPRGAAGIGKALRQPKWANATAEGVTPESGFFTLAPIKEVWDKYSPKVGDAIQAVKDIYNENKGITKTGDYRRSILNWSGKMQTSFNEAQQAQREITSKIRNPVRREGIVNWIEAGGDQAVLQQRLAATQAWRDPTTNKPHPQQKKLVAGYQAALNLNPAELAVAADVKAAFDTLGQRGQAFDVLGNFRDNYVTHMWDTGRGAVPAMAGGSRMLKDKFRFNKARTFNTFFDGEQAGYVPKTKDIAQILPAYLHEMNSVIAARQLVAEMAKGKWTDDRPLLAARGKGASVEGEQGKATLVMPEVSAEGTADYVRLDKQPALHDWRWAAKDAAGNNVFLKADLVVHPEAAKLLKNALGRSVIKEWYGSKTTATAEIPKAIVRFLDNIQGETKRTMLGLLAPFHQVQEGTHAVGHRVNPFFNNPKIDLVNDAGQRDAVRHGLMLAPDSSSASQFMEGFRHSGIVSKIPGIGPVADAYSHYLFHEYIPGVKYKTYAAILERNKHVYAKDLAAGKLNLEDIKILSSEQANAAYGHLNYSDLGRNPTIQHLMQLGLLAPDFLEARMRFAGQSIKGVTGAKVGREQLLALSFLAASQAALAWMSAKATGGQWDPKDPFAFHVGNRKFTMRSVPEDTLRMLQDPRAFWYARLNPLIGRGAVQYATRTDWRGQKVSGWETTKELATQPIPLTLRPLFGLGNSPLSGWEQLMGSAGLVIKRYSAQSEIRKKAHEWMGESTDPKIRAAEERFRKETFADSDYKPMREALINNDYATAQKAYIKLLETKNPRQIDTTMNHPRPITGNQAWEPRFLNSLSPEDRVLYNQAKSEQRELIKKYQRLRALMAGATTTSQPAVAAE